MSKIESFSIDGVHFRMDFRPGPERGTSTTNDFILVKTQSLLERYRELGNHKPRSILEIGMFEGGSLAFFDKLYRPETLVGLDTRGEIGPLEEYRATRPHITTLYRQSQDDPELPDVLREHFPTGIDLIVDDASHLYQPTRKALESCFPLLNRGGHYIIEDWRWSHQPAYQDSAHPWHDRPALTNLIVDLVLAAGGQRRSHALTIFQELVIVEKLTDQPIDFDGIGATLRGRSRDLL